MIKKQITGILRALESDLHTKTGLPVNPYNPDELVGKSPELKLRFVGMNGLSVNSNVFLNKGILKFDLQITNELLNTDTIASTIVAIIKTGVVIDTYLGLDDTVHELTVPGIIQKITYSIIDDDEYGTEGIEFVKIFKLELKIA